MIEISISNHEPKIKSGQVMVTPFQEYGAKKSESGPILSKVREGL